MCGEREVALVFSTGGYGVEVGGVIVATYDEYRLAMMRASLMGGTVVYLTVTKGWTR